MALPKNIVPPPRKGPRTIRKAGVHDTRPRGQRDRAGTRRAALRDQDAR